MASHAFSDIQDFCDQAIYVEQGRIEYSGSCEEAGTLPRAFRSGRRGIESHSKNPGAAPSAAIIGEKKSRRAGLPLRRQRTQAEHDRSRPKPEGRRASRAELLVAIARRVGVPEEVAQTFSAITDARAGSIEHAFNPRPNVAIGKIVRAGLAKRYGRDGARARYLALALFQVPAAEARREAQGIDLKHMEATLADLGGWHGLPEVLSFHGITLDTLNWAQRYLAGDLARFGPAQYDMVPFPGEIRAYRQPATRILSVTLSPAGPSTTRGT